MLKLKNKKIKILLMCTSIIIITAIFSAIFLITNKKINLDEVMNITNIKESNLVFKKCSKNKTSISPKYSVENMYTTNNKFKLNNKTGEFYFIKGFNFTANLFKTSYKLNKNKDILKQIDNYIDELTKMCIKYEKIDEKDEITTIFSFDNYDKPVSDGDISNVIYNEKITYRRKYVIKNDNGEKEFLLNFYINDEKLICEFANMK